MILIDFNGVVIGHIVMAKEAITEGLVRHIILNTLRMHNKKFRDQYGSMVVCLEGVGNWRKRHYPQYKANRKASRETDGLDWDEIFRLITMVQGEIRENLPWYVIQVNECEADDVIAQIALTTQEFGQFEDVMIVSSDKDFLQLQEGNNTIKQYCPRFKKYLKQEAKFDLHEHICKGDSSDGVPNIMSGDNVFVEGIRQTPMMATKIAEFRDKTKMPEEVLRNYLRNEELINLEKLPVDIKDNILEAWENKRAASPLKALNYLIKKRCRLLIECVGDFKNA